VRDGSTSTEKQIPILIAEHLEADRFLFQAYCEATEFQATFTSDGQQAVAIWQSGSFEIAVIDVRLPVIDGLSVIKEIRRIEKERGTERVPILALLTTNSDADVVRAQEAGCDAQFARPILKKAFLGALEQLRAGPAAAKSGVLIQIPQGLEELAHRYITSREMEIPVLQGLMEQSDFDGIRKLAHNLKGTGTSYGFPDITRLGTAIEHAAKASDKPEASREMAELFSYIESASRQLGLYTQ
jgi:CheY-like chemotaxis protein